MCLFDDDRRVVFANSACGLFWVGVPLADLIGRRASFSSADHADSTPADGICPPRDAFAGQRMSGVVFATAEGQLRRRRAEFVPLDAVEGGSAPVLVLCSTTDESLADRPIAAGPNDDSTILHQRVAQFHAQQRCRFRLEHLVGDGAAMQLAKAQVEAAIASHASVTVVGRPGTGRQWLARAIHYNSETVPAGDRKDRHRDNLVVLDGSLLTGDIVNSAVVALTAQGRVSPVTVLLLHLDRLPSDLQPEIVPLFVHRFAARFLAISEVPPSELAAQGQLHPLLASAASTLIVRLPPLAQRREDIPMLAQLFVEEHNAKGNKQLRNSPEAIDELVAYSWPGDVAELRGLVEEALATRKVLEISPADLPRRLSQATGEVRRPPRGTEAIVLEEFLAGIERELIEHHPSGKLREIKHAPRGSWDSLDRDCTPGIVRLRWNRRPARRSSPMALPQPKPPT